MFKQTLRTEEYKARPRDVVYTPAAAVNVCMPVIEPMLSEGDAVCDAFAGKDAFFKKYPTYVISSRCEIEEGTDFFDLSAQSVDWIISNPPYSNLTDVLVHSARVCRKGFGYLIGSCNLTHARIHKMELAGFHLHTVKVIRVNHWFGMSMFCVWTREDPIHGARMLYHPIQIDDPSYASRQVKKKAS
jgi:hypothetical protein